MKTVHPARSVLRSVLIRSLLGIGLSSAPGLAPATDLHDEISALKARLEAQRRQLDEQAAQLRDQERLLRELERRAATQSAATVSPAPSASPAASAPSTPAMSAPPPTAASPENLTAGTAPVVTSRFDGIKVTLGGALRTTVNTTTARMQPDATPFFVLPTLHGVAEGTTKIDARLSSLFFSIEGAQLGDFRLSGSIHAYLFDGNLLSGKYGFYPGFAYVDATSERWRFAAGLQMDVFSPLMPTMVDRMSAFAGSGNTGNSFKPQLRAEHVVPLGADRWVLQAALADAVASNIKPPSNAEPGAASIENTGMPNLEARIAYTRGKPGDGGGWLAWAPLTLGVSAAHGRFRTFSLINAFPAWETRFSGLALEGAWRIGPRFGIQGELYGGRALGQYLGTIFQTANSTTREGIGSRGGWGEAAWYWSPTMHSHLGFGLDRANAEQVPTGGFTSNRTGFLNLFWDPSRLTTLAIEGTWRRTGYSGLGEFSGWSLMLSSELRF